MFAYQTAAFRRGKGIDSLVTFGSPVDAQRTAADPALARGGVAAGGRR